MKNTQRLLMVFVICTLLNPLIADGHQPRAVLKCAFVPLSTHYRDAKVVFSGQVLDVKPAGDYIEVRFKILRSWKNARVSEITVYTYPITPETPDFIEGHSYLVFADMFNDKLLADGCSGTVELRYVLKRELRQLERWSTRRNKSRK